MSFRDSAGVPIASNISVTHCLNEDCIVCTKAKFRVRPFRSVPNAIRQKIPPFAICYADGFGGQHSMGTRGANGAPDMFGEKSVGGAVGGYVFYCASGGSIIPMLYSSKAQFPMLLRRFLLGVLMKGHRVRIIRATDAEIISNAAVDAICAEHDIDIQAPSVGTPEDMGLAEKAVGDIMRLARAFVIGAPHLPKSLWAAAVIYAGVVNEVLPKAFNGGITPYENSTMRPPDLQRLFIGIWGCPCEAVRKAKDDKYKDKMQPRTVSMYFVGTEYPSVLVYHPAKKRIYSVSRRKVRLHEGTYLGDDIPSNLNALRERCAVTQDAAGDDDEIIDSVPYIRSLRQVAHRNGIDQGEECGSMENHQQPYQEIVDLADNQLLNKLTEQIIKSFRKPSLQKQLIDIVRGSLAQETHDENTMQDSIAVPPGARAESEPDNTSHSNTKTRTRTKTNRFTFNGKTKAQPSEEVRTKLAKLSKLRKPLYAAPIGTRVRIRTEMFDDADNPGSYSHDKPAFTHGTIAAKSKGGVLRVLWDGDHAPTGSYWKHLAYSVPVHIAHVTEQLGYPTSLGCQAMAVNVANVQYTDPHVNVVRSPKLLSYLQNESRDIRDPGYFVAVAKAMGVPQTSEPYRSLIAMELIAKTEHMMALATKTSHNPLWPKSFAECLLDNKWRDWLTAVRKEHGSWQEKNVAKEVQRNEREPTEALIRIGELYTVKRCGTHKFRPYMMGNLLRENIDYYSTFSGTVTADSIRLFFSLACAMRKTVKGGDVTTAYLCGEQKIKIFAYKPSYWDFVHMPMEELMEIRKHMQKLHKQGGLAAVRRFAKQTHCNDKILEIQKPVYGIPDAGHEWGLLLTHNLTSPEKLGMQRSFVDGCMYYKTDVPICTEHGPYRSGLERKVVSRSNTPEFGEPNRRDAQWTKEFLLLISWTDDLPYFGTPKMVAWYEKEAPKYMPVKFVEKCTDFVSIEVKHDEEYGLIELTHSKYCLQLGEKYGHYLAGRTCKVPMKPGVDISLVALVPTEEDHEKAEYFPYRELVGSIAFPTCHTKLEARFAVSILSRFLHNWTLECIDALLDLLAYMIHSHDVGLVYSCGLDQHGKNVLYAFADSSFGAPRSQGGRMVKMNGAAVSNSSQRHSTTDTSTTAAELTEAYLASNDVCGFRNMVYELGITLDEPTKIFQDNMPAIQVAEGERNLTETTRHMPLRTWKLRERLDEQEITMPWCSTKDMQADLNTKALPTKTFVYLRDNMNGYALVRLNYPERHMPAAVISTQELVETLNLLDSLDEERTRKRAESAKANKKKRKYGKRK